MELVECQDVGVSFNFFSSFSNDNSSDVCNPQFFQGRRHLPFCCQRKLPNPDKSFGSVDFYMWVGSAFCCMKGFHFSASLRLSTLISKFPSRVFFTFFGVDLIFITFSLRKGENMAWQTYSKIQWQWIWESQMPHSQWLFLICFVYFFLFEDAIDAVYFSLTRSPTTHHEVQLVMGYTKEETDSPWLRREYQFHFLSTGQIPILSTQLTLSYRFLAPKR